jgi:D-lactate dehydrogenase
MNAPLPRQRNSSVSPALIIALQSKIPKERLITDELRRLTWGSDASFYRMLPQVVVVVEGEADVAHVLRVAREHQIHVTFRAAGTSLSGQAVTDGILVLIGEGFATYEMLNEGAQVKLGPGIIGGEVNRRLAPLGRKIGPDPASIATCKIGGIAANNSSGMCCGTSQNTYRTMASMRVMLADGAVLDSADQQSISAFKNTHSALLNTLAQLGEDTRANPPLAGLIRHKYKIKNTTGYSLNAFTDFVDPIDILCHLMIGSEGTLGFISNITYNTVPEHAHKASALVFFNDIASACDAVLRLKPLNVSAVELLDRASLRSVENKAGLPAIIKQLGTQASALLIEVRDGNAAALQDRIDEALAVLPLETTIEPASFSTDPAVCEVYWNVRKGTFPSVGAMRATGTTVIIEDVAFPVESLAAATLDLQALLQEHGYHEAIIFGHALEGNLHFVFTQDFGDAKEIERYRLFMEAIAVLVIDKYQGSLKAEHGTGRNMAPFVEQEWGREATDLMRRLKHAFDPVNLLNPGVILNANPHVHLENLKPMPKASAVVDKCIECGFCEPKCPSHQLTLSPRQRIIAWRDISRHELAGQFDKPFDQQDAVAKNISKDYVYMGLDTCAGCGLCSTACPVGINTGSLIRELRGKQASPVTAQLASKVKRNFGHWTSEHFATFTQLSRVGLKLGHLAASTLGQEFTSSMSRGAWRRVMPKAARPVVQHASTVGEPVVYFPTCASRVFGTDNDGDAALPDVIQTLLVRAGYSVRIPENLEQLCCGQMLASKGLAEEADASTKRLEAALAKASDNGRYPIITDASACSLRVIEQLAGRLPVQDFHDFAHDHLLSKLKINKQSEPIALHVNCSVQRNANSAKKLQALTNACTNQVIQPAGVGCCGFGGDRGFVAPELNRHALRKIHAELPNNCAHGVSTNRTCEIGLTSETGRPYRSVAYLLEECSRETK